MKVSSIVRVSSLIMIEFDLLRAVMYLARYMDVSEISLASSRAQARSSCSSH
jgi:hypothetical protein